MNNVDEDCLREIMELKTEMAILREHTEQNKAILETMYGKLFGNGQEGIITTVTKHKVYFALLSASIAILAGCVVQTFI